MLTILEFLIFSKKGFDDRNKFKSKGILFDFNIIIHFLSNANHFSQKRDASHRQIQQAFPTILIRFMWNKVKPGL